MNDSTKNRANPFDKAYFIKPDTDFDKTDKTYAPLFRKTFEMYDNIESAEVLMCGLGIGYFYINGRAASEDLFTAPVSDYNKTLWFNRYKVTAYLKYDNGTTGTYITSTAEAPGTNRLEIAFDTNRLHLFDKETGLAILN